MRFLDLDLDFFLNENAYHGGFEGGRLGPEHRPWSVSKVRRFLEDRCGLSPDVPVQGRTIESHDGVLDFWRTLIESGWLKTPFEVIHIDAHPDLWVAGGMYLTSDYLHVDQNRELEMLKNRCVHSGNYINFAIARKWIASLVWIPLCKQSKGPPIWDADARFAFTQSKKKKDERSPIPDSTIVGERQSIPFKVLSWHEFRTSETFDYIALSKSPSFTPLESDRLIPVIEEYMQQI